MPDMLIQMYQMQKQLQEETYSGSPRDLEGEERVMFAKDMILASADELHEALGEIGWKPWATSRHFNEEAFQGELVDLWHFFMNLMLVSNMTPEMLYEKYKSKRAKNILRQMQGYDGVATKCPLCKRALDDDAVNCSTPRVDITGWGDISTKPGYCEKEGITY